MAKRRRQQLYTIAALCLVLAILIIGCFFAGKYEQSREEADNDTEIVLFDVEEDNILKLCYANDIADVTLVKENDIWKIEEDKDFPVEQDLIENMIEDIVSVSATRLVTKECTDLSEYELEEPLLFVTLTDQEGRAYKIAYGMESAAAGGCYAYTDSTSTVYVVPSNVISDFEYSKNQLMELPEIPEIDEDRMISYSVRTALGETFTAKNIEASKMKDDDTEKSDNSSSEEKEDSDNDTDADSEDTPEWNIKKSSGKVTDYDQSSMEEVTFSLTDLNVTEGVSYRSSKKELKKYKLEEPEYTISVEYYTLDDEETEKEDKVNHSLKMFIGTYDDTEENYYVSFEGIEGIYLMSVDTVDTLLSVVK